LPASYHVTVTGRTDLLVNNAGHRIRSPLEGLPRAEWDMMIGTNLTACPSSRRRSAA
jgi:NADP-dependent 3-hydroxy acid dehydrogenase YdfG